MTEREAVPASPAERRALLAERLTARLAERNHPLAYSQQRLWFLEQTNPHSPVYLVPLQYRISGRLDVAVLQQSLTELVRRHQALRTAFRTVDEMPRQHVQLPAPVVIDQYDLTEHEEPELAAARIAREVARQPFDLEAGSLLRAALLRLGATEHWLCLTLHHIACDGWSLGLMASELAEMYRAFLGNTEPALPALPIQYSDYAERQAVQLGDGRLADVLDYWRAKLAGLPTVASLPTDFARPVTQSHRGGHLSSEVEPLLCSRIREYARERGVSPFVVLLAAFCSLVYAHTGSADVIVGVPVAGRLTTDVQNLIGFFANTVVERIDVGGEPSFEELVRRVQAENLAALAHQELPFERLVEELQPVRDPAHNPIFQLLFSYYDGDSSLLSLDGCQVASIPTDTESAKFDLTLSITSLPDRLAIRLEYSTDLFTEGTARRLAEQYRTVLATSLRNPEQAISRCQILTAAELRMIQRDWHPASGPEPAGLIHELFAAQAARTPDAVCLLGPNPDNGTELTYQEVDRRADVLAGRLRARGVRPDTPVGIYLDRSPATVIGLLAILKAGGAYLPLDPAFPRERLRFMVTDSGAPVVLTRTALRRGLAGLPVEILLLDGDEQPPVELAPPPRLSPDNLAYVIYTSGSTGRPKGVLVSHRNVLNFFAGADRLVGSAQTATWLAVTSISFDISVLELLWTVSRGHRVVIRADEPGIARLGGSAVAPGIQAREFEFSLFYFGGDRGGEPQHAYRLMLEGARFADEHGFTAVWTPERHFHEFGSLYPNPAVTAAAIAAMTNRVAVRAGSVVLPLHDTLRVAEEWSVVDNVSGGRVGISIASGWQPDDFVLSPDNYGDRKKIMLQALAELRALWRGEAIPRRNGVHAETSVSIFPRPLQRELPVWLTSAKSPETFQIAGEIGANLLTHLLGHSIEQLAGKISLYREARQAAGHPGPGHVTLMLHTFVGPDREAVREIVRDPLRSYIRSSADLLSGLGEALGVELDLKELPAAELEALASRAFDRFFDHAGLLGTPEHCADFIDTLKSIGVDEVACLIDFGVDHDRVLDSLHYLATVAELTEERRRQALANESIVQQLRRYQVTHLQTTPSLAGALLEEPGALPQLGRLRQLLVGGEALPEPLAAALAGSGVPSAYNMYGPTEATVWATADRIRQGAVTIGQPMANVGAYVVDRHLRQVPVNAAGELLLGGPGIARGYLDRPALTAQRFIPDPFSGRAGTRLYRTGDLVRWRAAADGTETLVLEFLGRLDDQVKLHGHRIELGEIDSALQSHPGIRAAVTVVADVGDRRRLVGYCVPSQAGRPGADEAEIKAYLGQLLPGYMVPAEVLLLDTLPMTPNGKVDRARLPAPAGRTSDTPRPPTNDTERAVATVFTEVLHRERVGIDDNFFEHGGNSLLAVKLRGRLLPILGPTLSIVDIFRYPTVHLLTSSFLRPATAGSTLDQARDNAERRTAALAQRARISRGAG